MDSTQNKPSRPTFTPIPATSAHPSPALDGRYLTFRLGAGSYGISVLKVQEIIRLAATTAVPGLPPHLRGVINLRGRIVPIIDLRARFAMPAQADGARTCIIVVQLRTATCGLAPMGLVVDAVDEVLAIGRDEVTPPPDFGCAVDVAFLLGLARVRGEVKALLDIDRVLTGEQLAALEAAA
jgi:purine-binding chemotaxis protein CheW